MRLEHLTVRGFMTAFAGKQVDLDFAELPPGLIAIVGDNGAGKSTLLEAAPAGLYRQMLSREGDLKTYAQDRDSFIESRWTVGHDRYRARLAVDGIKGGANAVLAATRSSVAEVALNDGKVSTFDPAIAGIFPPLHVFKASAFATQNKSGSFVKASKKERRDIFAAFLGVDRLIAMSETAKACAAAVDQVRAPLLAAIDVLARETAAEVLDAARRQQQALLALAEQATSDRTKLSAQIHAVEAQLAQLSDQVAAHAAAADRVQVTGLVVHERHTALGEQVAADAEAARREGQDRQAIESGYAAKVAALDTRARTAAASEAAELAHLADELAQHLADIDAKLAGNQQIQNQAAEIRAAVETVAAAAAAIAALTLQLEHQQDQERQLEARRRELEAELHSFTQPKADLARAKSDAALLEAVPCGGRGAYAACELLVNAKAAEARIGELEAIVAGMTAVVAQRQALADQIRAAADAITETKRQIASETTRQRAAQPKAQYAEKLAASQARVEELQRYRAEQDTRYAQLIAAAKARHATARDHRVEERAALDGEYAGATTRHAQRVADRLELSTRKRVLLQAQLDAAVADYEAALKALHALTGVDQAAQLQAQLQQLRADRDTAVTVQATAEADAAAVGRRLVDLETKAQQLAIIRGRLAKLDQELVDWQLLQKALDRDGLPNLEIDQAGPAISATANEILADCFGPRFSLELVTQVARADGKGMKEEFTVLVTDNANGGVQRDIGDLSGGEEVIVDEALKNAIAIFVNERSQTPMRTCFRDETTGALTKENTQRYVQMLRKVQAIGGFHQILFISHDPDAYAMADAQIRVAGGAATTVLPPYAEAA